MLKKGKIFVKMKNDEVSLQFFMSYEMPTSNNLFDIFTFLLFSHLCTKNN